jgi:hypothetical protein
MGHTNIMESGTCAALPLRDAWGRPRRTSWWSDTRSVEGSPIRTTTDSVATRPQAWTLPVSA